MKNIIIFLFFTSLAFACSGDCASCHPKLVDEKGNYKQAQHKKLILCKSCHSAENMEKVDMGDGGCGQDCWECHSLKKVASSGIAAHNYLSTCEQCHKKNDTKEFLKNIKTQIKPVDKFLNGALETKP